MADSREDCWSTERKSRQSHKPLTPLAISHLRGRPSRSSCANERSEAAKTLDCETKARNRKSSRAGEWGACKPEEGSRRKRRDPILLLLPRRRQRRRHQRTPRRPLPARVAEFRRRLPSSFSIGIPTQQYPLEMEMGPAERTKGVRVKWAEADA